MPTIDIDRDAAREAAERELSKPIYPRPSPKQQFIDFLEELVQRLIRKGAELPGGWFTISVLLILLAAAVVAAVAVGRRMLRDGRGDQRLFGTVQRSADEHRATAQHRAAAGDWAEAIRHRLRAVARELEETGVLHAAAGAPRPNWPATPAPHCPTWRTPWRGPPRRSTMSATASCRPPRTATASSPTWTSRFAP